MEATLRHLDRQIPLSVFGSLYAHLKADPVPPPVGLENPGTLAESIANDLSVRGFYVDTTVGDWQRGMSMQNAYLIDQRKASQSSAIQGQPYMLLLEDDGTMSPKVDNLTKVLARMIDFLESSPDAVSARFLRRCDYDGGVPMDNVQGDHFFSRNVDFQPMLLRSRDFFLAHKVIEDNWAQLSHLQCELVMRLALDTFSRGSDRHMVWLPDYAETIHLGTPDYSALKASLNL